MCIYIYMDIEHIHCHFEPFVICLNMFSLQMSSIFGWDYSMTTMTSVFGWGSLPTFSQDCSREVGEKWGRMQTNIHSEWEYGQQIQE